MAKEYHKDKGIKIAVLSIAAAIAAAICLIVTSLIANKQLVLDRDGWAIQINRRCYAELVAYAMPYNFCNCDFCLRFHYVVRNFNQACVIVGLQTTAKYEIKIACLNQTSYRWLVGAD